MEMQTSEFENTKAFEDQQLMKCHPLFTLTSLGLSNSAATTDYLHSHTTLRLTPKPQLIFLHFIHSTTIAINIFTIFVWIKQKMPCHKITMVYEQTFKNLELLFVEEKSTIIYNKKDVFLSAQQQRQIEIAKTTIIKFFNIS